MDLVTNEDIREYWNHQLAANPYLMRLEELAADLKYEEMRREILRSDAVLGLHVERE